jgi:hypothetical protein
MSSFPTLGAGVGLRTVHYADVLDLSDSGAPQLDDGTAVPGWFEIISDNFTEPGGNPRRVLEKVRSRFPVVMHGVALSLGSTDPLDGEYLDRLSALASFVEPALISDHLCWNGVAGHNAHDLLPIPYTEEALAHVAERVLAVQDRLGRCILVENVSSYVRFRQSVMQEWEFLAALTERTGCGVLLDVNNVFVSAHNHGFGARTFIAGIPRGRVGQIHLAGHSRRGELLVDTHDHAVRPEVWDLYRHAIELHGDVATLIEWDDRIPSFARVSAEAERAAGIAAAVRRAGEDALHGA